MTDKQIAKFFAAYAMAKTMCEDDESIDKVFSKQVYERIFNAISETSHEVYHEDPEAQT